MRESTAGAAALRRLWFRARLSLRGACSWFFTSLLLRWLPLGRTLLHDSESLGAFGKNIVCIIFRSILRSNGSSTGRQCHHLLLCRLGRRDTL